MHYFQKILEDLDVKYTLSFAHELFESRIDGNSLYGIKKLLETYDVHTTAVRIADKDISQMEYPFIASYQGYYSVLKSQPEDIDDFINYWDGIALIVNDGGRRMEPHYYMNKLRIILSYSLPIVSVLALAFLTVVSLFNSSGNVDWHKLVIYLLLSLGAFFSWRTVSNECSGSCHNVLESSASKLFGLFSLGAIGLSYFVSSFIVFLVLPSFEPIFALVSCVAIIMPIWSVSYQKFIVHSWCKNCLGVQSSLVMIFVVELLFGRVDINSFRFLSFIEFVALYIVVFYICYKVYELVQKLRKYPDSLVLNYLSLMQNKNVIQYVIDSGKEYDTTNASTLTISDPKDENAMELYFLLSPFCGHCRDLFSKLYEYYSVGRLSRFKVSIIFDDNSAVHGSIIAEYQQNGPEAALKLLAKWYESPKINQFRKMYEQYEKTPQLLEETSRQQEWCKKNDIQGTPMMIVNSHLVSHLLLDGIIQ